MNGDVLAWDGIEWKPSLAPSITEQIEDIVGLMIGGGVHSGINVDYDDDIGTISISNQYETISALNDTAINLPLTPKYYHMMRMMIYGKMSTFQIILM